MLALLGGFGRLLEYFLKKLGDHYLDARLDERKRALRAFLRMHDALGAAEAVTRDFARRVETTIRNSPHDLKRAWARGSSKKEALEVSTEFFRAFRDVIGTVSLADRSLATLLGSVWAHKVGLRLDETVNNLAESGSKYQIVPYWAGDDWLTQTIEKITYPVIDTDLTRALATRKDEPLVAVCDSLVKQVELQPSDIEGLRALHSVMEEHRSLLTEARERMADFIARNFSLDDLLYVRRLQE